VTPAEGTPTPTAADQSLIEATQTLGSGAVTLADADQTVTTTVAYMPPSQSRSPSLTASPSGTSAASASASPSGTSAASASPSGTSVASASPSGTSAASVSASPSDTSAASASPSGTSAASASPSGTSAASASASPSASQTASTSLSRTKTPIAAECGSLPVQYETDEDSKWMVIGCDNGQRIGSVCTLTCPGRLAERRFIVKKKALRLLHTPRSTFLHFTLTV
jgi:hypothetical protein